MQIRDEDKILDRGARDCQKPAGNAGVSDSGAGNQRRGKAGCDEICDNYRDARCRERACRQDGEHV
jgi:hypothetical protein